MSNISDICSDISSVLSGEGITVIIDHCPDLEIPTVKARKYYLVPAGEDMTNLARGVKNTKVTVSLAMLEKIDPTNIDQRILIVEGIADLLLGKHMTHGTVTACTFSPIYDIDWMRTSHIFLSNLQITVMVN